jgi:hemoglobin-like flavoprotein
LQNPLFPGKQLKQFPFFSEAWKKQAPLITVSRTDNEERIMNEETITLLQKSFLEFSKGKEESAALFYERLFALDPSLRKLFVHVEMKSQQTKLMAALALVINNLRDLSGVVPVLESLALRHINYGVEDQHYKTVGTALIQSMALFFGPRFDAATREAWVTAYGAVSQVMIDAVHRSKMAGQAAE